jgi:hypothetical protein
MMDRTRTARVLDASTEYSTRRPSPRVLRVWIALVIAMVAMALLVFAVFYALDHIHLGGGVATADSIWQHYLQFDADLISDATPALGVTIVAALGIVLTVVAIIVQLSSDRYTGVALMFMRDPINVTVLSLYVIASLCAVWLSVSLRVDFVPRTLLLLVMGLTSIALVVMLPYFAYVFWFLEPGNIIDRLRFHTSQLSRRGIAAEAGEQMQRLQGRVLTQMEEITDIANNSIDGKDKIVAGRAVDALRDFLLDYFAARPGDEDRPWYHIGGELRESPDFVAMDLELIRELELRRLWVEWKTLRQFLGIYNEALRSMPDINYLIAIDTRYIGEAAAIRRQTELIRMVYRYMNSYLRSAISHGNVRTAYNVLHQYRMLIETLLHLEQGDTACEGVAFLKYYGHVAYEEELGFVTETVAYDLVALCRYAHRESRPEEERILRHFLDLDGPTRGYRQERSLKGVRKAQAKLAVYYLSVGSHDKARMIAEDMRGEPAELRHTIRDELARADSPNFWEIVDRGRNFEYLPQNERALLGTFFGWMDAAPDSPP